MKAEPLDIKLKRNSNISFKIEPQFCKCSRPMFLKKSQDGNMFWACKGFYADESVCICDLTKDVKCFKCSGEIRKKENKNTGEKFYGCTNYSTVSEEGCNFTLDPEDLNDVIAQVNDALKFRFNFRSTQFDSGDERIWEKYKKEHIDNVNNVIETKPDHDDDCDDDDKDDEKEKVETKWWFKIIKLVLNKKKSDSKPEKSYMGIPPKILKYVIVGIFIVASMTVINGSGIEARLFGGLFEFTIQPKKATAEKIDVNYNSIDNTFSVKNTTGEKMDVSSVKVNNEDGETIIDLSKLSQEDKFIGPNETLILKEEDIRKLVSPTVMDEYSEEMEIDEESDDISPGEPSEKSFIQNIFKELIDGNLEVVTKDIKGKIQKVQTEFKELRSYREPQEQVCNEYEEDCDGEVDEDFRQEEIFPINPIEKRRDFLMTEDTELR